MKLNQACAYTARLELSKQQREWLRERCLCAYRLEEDAGGKVWLLGISDTLVHSPALVLSAYNLRRLKQFVQSSLDHGRDVDAATVDRILSEKLFDLLPDWNTLDLLIKLEEGRDNE